VKLLAKKTEIMKIASKIFWVYKFKKDLLTYWGLINLLFYKGVYHGQSKGSVKSSITMYTVLW